MTLTQVFRRAGVFAAAALLVTSVSIKPVTVFAMGTDSPPPADDGKKKKKKKDQSVIEQQEQQMAQEKFLRDYRAARQLILDGQYEAGITAMHALGHDEHPDDKEIKDAHDAHRPFIASASVGSRGSNTEQSFSRAAMSLRSAARRKWSSSATATKYLR